MRTQRRRWRRCWSDTSNRHHEVVEFVHQRGIGNSSAAIGCRTGVAVLNGPHIGMKASTMAHRGFRVVEDLLRRLILKEFFKIRLSQLEAITLTKLFLPSNVPAAWSAFIFGRFC